MADLVNMFSWSISAREDFEECPRRRFWSKYAMWNGWNPAAAPLTRTAYRLGKMDNRFSLQGRAVETAVLWALRQVRAGQAVTADQAYEAAARPLLNLCWTESRQKRYLAQPKQCCCLHEHYYPGHHRTPEPEMIAHMAVLIKTCLAHFIANVLPRLQDVKPEEEIPVAPGGRGDPESFLFEEIKVYAIPDYVYRRDGILHIHDWKAGQPKPAHQDQVRLYGLWAHTKHAAAPGAIHGHLEYLAVGLSQGMILAEPDLEQARALVRQSVAAMAEYLVNGDLRKNQPLPKEDWELSADAETCRRCNFFELCKDELEAG